MSLHNMKTCIKCNVEKGAECFGKHKRMKDGLYYYCKSCVSEISKTYKKQWRKNGGLKREMSSLESDPVRRMKKRIRSLIAISITKAGYSKKTKAFSILGADIDVVKKHLESKFKPGMSWENHGEWHIDHIVPMSSAESEEEAMSLNHYTNLQPLWANENLQKGAKLEYTTV